jgi:hypothetical protein
MAEPWTRDSIDNLEWIPTLLRALDDAIHPLVHPSFVPAPGSRKA